ncbi:MAG: competence/damage-inducible protein A [Betaproteobacteria bacterium]|jgi:molybdopterin-biosynthesis enzyme MoeA-like protein|nr:competence/damage-inducible protein A [Rhodocyclaceae bacterium]MCA3133502.1 competence/damage-inducible protein A [Rhodocyclaceae bacterium]MCA3141436.1 competence/damage-inducible protein A [Rhodocyclaceae bacterium]MCA3145767.1 competence/damage-inducible protein A [Rhodocyclaceae bacterium]MCE2897963.1 competence/damage-inducible protein A [Betaproteobacteria bacterium]
MTAFGVFIIGDEILSGKRQDKHLARVIGALAGRGLALAWARYLGDERDRIAAALRETLATPDVVFSFGGIGATPDDHTRQAAAQAAGVPLELHPEAKAEIEARFGAEAYPRRIRMGEFPAGSLIVPNPFNRVPGFSLGNHHFLPGFPEMAWSMLEWLLDTRYGHLRRTEREVDEAILVREAGESQLVDLMNVIVSRYPQLKLFSLPHLGPGQRHIELGVRGEAMAVARAMVEIRAGVAGSGFPWEPREPLPAPSTRPQSS